MHLVGFAESSDGLAFTKPDLNQHFLPNGQVLLQSGLFSFDRTARKM